MPETNIPDLLARLEPTLRAAFEDALELVKSDVQIGLLIEALERQDINSAMDALSLDPSVFRTFERALAESYAAGGDSGTSSMPRLPNPSGGRFIVRFDIRNPRAEIWLAEHSSNLVTRIVNEQRDVIRTALTDGMERGQNPRKTALNIAGRVDPLTQRRVGGMVGLSAPQAEYITTARNELLSGDPKQLRNYLTRKRRDKRFDSAVRRAIADGTPVSADTVTRASGRYSDQLLRLRAETIARTETLASLHAGQDEAFRQAIEKGAVREQDVRRVWRNAGDSRVRDEHVGMEGEIVGVNEAFSNGLMYPSEPNCRCHLDIRIDHLANVA